MLDTCVNDTVNYKKFESLICDGLESTQLSRAMDFLGFWEQSETARKAFSDSTAMEDTARQSKSRLIASNSIMEDHVDKVSLARLILVSSSIDSLEPQALNSNSPSYIPTSPDLPESCINSSHGSTISPALERKAVNAGDSAESAEPQLPDLQPELREEHITDDILRAHFPANRRDFFHEVANIGSSSPVNNSGRPGYDTPVYMRRLQSLHKGCEIQLTPTLAPAENEEGFVGSSPTPATRDPTPAMNSDVPVLKHQDIMMTDASDPPSSPPGLDSRSPSPNKSLRRKKNERRRSAKAKEAMLRRAAEQQTDMNSPAPSNPYKQHAADAHDDVPEDPKENNAADQSDERPPSRRTRSALGHGAFNDQNAGFIAPIDTPAKNTDSPSVQSTKSKSASKKKRRRRNPAKPSSEESQQTEQVDSNDPPIPAPEPLLEPAPAPAPDYSIDSSSEDVETQIASQLEQDLELAVDLRENIDEIRREDQPRSPVSTKKRKRDDIESRTPTATDRRRSTRLSSTKEIDAGGMNEGNTPSVKLLSPTLRRSTRGSQRNEESTSEVSENQEHNEDEETPRPPSKRSRKLARLEGQSTPAGTEESSSQVRSTPDKRSRKTRSSRRQSKILEDQHDDQDVVPDSLPLVSTEEATDSQMTEMGSSIDVQTNMKYEMSQYQRPSVVIKEVANIDDAEYHTTPQLPHSDTPEEGIAESLKKLLGDMKSAALGPDALREVDDLLFNIRIEAHEASRRYNA